MKLKLSRQWFEKRIANEGATDVTAGSLSPTAIEELAETPTEPSEVIVEERELHLAFGALIRLLRRKAGLTVQELADHARVDVVEVLEVERDIAFSPRVRTVHQLASYFRLPERALLKLSGVTRVHSSRFRDEAIRFAAKSETVSSLTREERRALSEFVKYLSTEAEEKASED